jgi:hypothetical protein
MDYTQLTTLVGTVGFPIVACGALFWMINKSIAQIKESLDNNTQIMTKLLVKLGGETDDSK